MAPVDVPLFVVAGPTASGKTALAVALAHRFNGELVGADSMQVYRGMDIGTAKATETELGGIAHHMVDLVNPDQPFDAVAFVEQADRAIGEIASRGHRPIVVGGTGMYLRMLLHGVQKGPPPDPELRQSLTRRAQEEGWPALHKELARVDGVSAKKLHPNDGVRIVRALEVFLQSGKPLSTWQEEHGFAKGRYRFVMVGPDYSRPVLYERINQRVLQMVEQGFVEEVRQLLNNGVDRWQKSMMAVGYKQMVAHVLDGVSVDQTIADIQTETRRLAKRQLTWFRKEPGYEPVPPTEKAVVAVAKRFF